MRQTTRRKYYGRSNIAAALRSAANEMAAAITEAEKPPAETPLSLSLKKVLKSIEQAIEYERVYQLGRRRIKTKLEREKRALEELIREVTGTPITTNEKLTVRRREK